MEARKFRSVHQERLVPRDDLPAPTLLERLLVPTLGVSGAAICLHIVDIEAFNSPSFVLAEREGIQHHG